MSEVKYRIYPSALKGFSEMLRYEQVADEDWNKVSQAAKDRGEYPGLEAGDLKLTADEMRAKLEGDLIDSINRVPKGAMEAADKGTAFNEIVDCLIENRGSSNPDITIGSYVDELGMRRVRARINGQTYDYDLRLCQECAGYFKGSLPQYFVKAHMDTSAGTVEFYGYIDEWVGANVYDIKTTKKYTFGKYGEGWQHHLYPWCLVEMGLTTGIDEFTYVVIEWATQKKGEPLTAKEIYYETYTYDHAESGRRLRQIAERFIEWLELRREYIQDPRIFGGERPEGWHGTALTPEQRKQLI